MAKRGGESSVKAKSRKTPSRSKVASTKKSSGKDKNSEIRRIESLEAMVDDLQSSVIDLSRSLKQIISIGVNDEAIKNILSSSINGEVVQSTGGRIIGWASNSADLISPLAVSIHYGGKVVAKGIANKTLQELQGKNGASGKGFSILLPKQFYDGKSRSLKFRAGDSETELKNLIGPVSFNDGFPLEGGIKSNKGGKIVGWAIDYSTPLSPIVVAALYGNEIIAKVVADKKDNSLSGKLGKTNCHHGFELELPRSLGDGRKRNIRLVVVPWNYDLLDTPVECSFSS